MASLERDDDERGVLESEVRRLAAELEQLRAELEHAADIRRSSEELRDRYVDVFDRAPLPFLLLDSVGTIGDINAAATALLSDNESRRPLVGARFCTFLNDGDTQTLMDHLRRCADTKHETACEVRLCAGTPVQLWTRHVRPGSRLYPTLVVDLRAREDAVAEAHRALQAERTAVEASRAKDDFIAVLSHELRTPLTPVLAAVTAMQGRPDLSPAMRATCEMIARNIGLEARLIDDLLDVTRIARRKMRIEVEPLDVHLLLDQVAETVGPELVDKTLSLHLALDATRCYVSADAVRLKQVFWNLLRNAIKFTPQRGTIEIKSWNNDADRSSWLHVEVSDNGRGFEATLGSRLFQPFEQSSELGERNGGLGLGLAICRGIVELHGGRISGDSRGSNQGARFVVAIRNVEQPPATVTDEASPKSKRSVIEERPTRRILLVEDDMDTAEILTDLLQEEGYEVRTERSARGALTADLANIDLLISDIGLPDVSGLDLVRQLQARGFLPAVALSGYGTEADILASKNAGFGAHLTKPIDFASLLEAIREVGALPAPGRKARHSER